MQRPLFALIAALLSACAALAQSSISIDEAKIRAILKNDATVISLPIASFVDHPVKAELALSWVNSDATESNAILKNIVIPRGQSSTEAELEIQHPSIWTRLRYTITPDRTEARAFVPTTGIVALAHIADHVFEVRASYAGLSRPGSPITVHAQAVHPVTRQPVLGVEWNATLSIGKRDDVQPIKILKHSEGFADFTFDLPEASKDDDDEEEGKIEVTAKLGDFEQDVSIAFRPNSHPSGGVQSDKPIYQPGQSLHLRAFIKDAQGRAAAGAKVTLQIEDQDTERVHTVQLVASKFGIVQDDWTIPASASLGLYRIELTAEGDDHYRIAQHAVRVSRYELPTFSVTVKPDRPAYLPDQAARVVITGAYLFGKPVPKGRVKIVRNSEPVWNRKTRRSESSEEISAEGTAADDGTFAATIDLKADHEKLSKSETQRFQDIHFAAYYTDVTSGRTEQRRFDLRITREPIHVYFIGSGLGGSMPTAVYVSTSYADGRPASTAVEIQFRGQVRNVHTNRYGVGKAFLQNDAVEERPVIVKATDANGLTGHWRMPYWSAGVAPLRIDSAHTIHRTGQPVTLQITSATEAPAEQAVMIHAICDGRTIATRIVSLTGHHGEVTFPNQPDFRRIVFFSIWNGVMSDGEFRNKTLGSRAVIFPDVSDLKISASAERATYKPGEKASLRMQVTSADGKPVEAALGLAVVDQAVLERARTENEFGHRPWFACAFCMDEAETEIGGVRLNDLYELKPDAVITPELDLVAEAIVAKSSMLVVSESSETFADPPNFKFVQHQVDQIRAALDDHFAKSLEFPEDFGAFSRILGRQWYDLLDPWGKPYRVEFSAQRENRVISLFTSGPDKRMGTADDYVAGTISRPYFALLRRLIEETLKRQADYPATEPEFARQLSDNGLVLHSLRDPWGTPYHADVTTFGARRMITISSAGPDRKFQTNDDFTLAYFSGSYFSRATAEIARAAQAAAQAPQSVEEFRSSLDRAGVDISRYRDPWGRPYRLTSALSSRYADRVNASTVRVFGSAAVSKTEIIPVTQKFITISLRSDGPDGEENTDDDFDIARFPVLLSEKSAEPAAPVSGPAVAALQGNGTLSGTVTDSSGAVIVNAKVALFDAAHASYESVTGEDGAFLFSSLPVGFYSLNIERPGFMRYRMSEIPVIAGKTTRVDIELQIGMATEMVTVEAAAEPLQTFAALALTPVTVTGTPRVRDYFPETLLWLPEILTDKAGRARAELTLADSVTTWKLAAVASTLDGRTAQAEGEFRTFQPFFLDFNPPPVLTEGDQIELPVAIRNYLDKAQKVTVALQPNQWSAVKGEASRQVTVGANTSLNVAYAVQATRSIDKAPQRITASAAGNRDAIEKSSRVHPDGQEVVQSYGDFVAGSTSFGVTIPAAAISTATRGELRIYPNIASLLLESALAILETPHGCAEQTISAGYANLIAWKFAHSQGIDNPQIEKRALANVRLAVEALVALQNADGGVSYWPASDADIAVTAYALSFLVEASAIVGGDSDDMLRLVMWLNGQQSKDGRWMSTFENAGAEGRRTLLLTASVARALAAGQKIGVRVPGSVFAGAYHHIAQLTDRTDEPYMLANFILAALDSGDEALVGTAVSRLTSMGREERGGLYWDLRTNSPFYGWGTAGRYETTGLTVSALSAWRAKHPASAELDSPIRRGLVFLLRGRDGTGNWYSTQATLRAMHAIADASAVLGSAGSKAGVLEVRSKGRLVKTVTLPSDPKATDPILIDISSFLSAGDNQISLVPTGSGTPSALVRLTSTHWLPWEQTKVRSSPELRLAVRFDRLESNSREPIRCTVNAERVGFHGYGMILAEIGLPPGAEVDRSSLESVLEKGSSGVDHYEILPDRVVLYLWPKPGGATFDFFLSSRMPMTAKSAASILYDYYNPEALSEVAPFRWIVKQ